MITDKKYNLTLYFLSTGGRKNLAHTHTHTHTTMEGAIRLSTRLIPSQINAFSTAQSALESLLTAKASSGFQSAKQATVLAEFEDFELAYADPYCFGIYLDINDTGATSTWVWSVQWDATTF